MPDKTTGLEQLGVPICRLPVKMLFFLLEGERD